MKMNKFMPVPAWVAAATLAALGGCSTVDVSSGSGFAPDGSLVVLPIANYTETPEAGQRARSIAQSILAQKGFADMQTYPQNQGSDLMMAFNSDQNQQQALQWAQNSGARYALTGAVQEWRYKVGLDGEPVVGLTFNLVDLSTAQVVWSATGSRSGWSRSSLAGVGQSLIREMLQPLSAR